MVGRCIVGLRPDRLYVCFGPFGQSGADGARRLLVAGGRRPEIALQGGRRHQGRSCQIVDDLGADVSVGAIHGQARSAGGAGDLLAHPAVPAQTLLASILGLILHLAAFPALRMTCSPT